MSAQPKVGRHAISAPALHAARGILEYFELSSKVLENRTPASLPPSEYNVALIIDLCTCVFRLAPFAPQVRYWCERLRTGQAGARDIERFLLDLSIALNTLPSYKGGVLVMDNP